MLAAYDLSENLAADINYTDNNKALSAFDYYPPV